MYVGRRMGGLKRKNGLKLWGHEQKIKKNKP
jgi:hypothetical protein